MIDGKSDPGAWADEIASTGRFRAVAAPAWKLVPVEPPPSHPQTRVTRRLLG